MGIIKSSSLRGIECTDAYHVVSDVRYYKMENGVRFTLSSFFNRDARIENSHNWLHQTIHTFTPTGSFEVAGEYNISTACYNYVKTLDAWSGSVDI